MDYAYKLILREAFDLIDFENTGNIRDAFINNSTNCRVGLGYTTHQRILLTTSYNFYDGLPGL